MSAHKRFVRFKLRLQFILGQSPVLDLRPLGLGLRDRSSREPEFDLLPTLVIGDIGRRDTLHPEDFDFVAITPRQCVVNAW
jgi:hypothetical protein